MKSVHEMTADEIHEARTNGTPYYGTVMVRRSVDSSPFVEDGKPLIYSDVEDFCPFTLLCTIAKMRQQGWWEVPDNRYMRAGKHPKPAADRADMQLIRMNERQP